MTDMEKGWRKVRCEKREEVVGCRDQDQDQDNDRYVDKEDGTRMRGRTEKEKSSNVHVQRGMGCREDEMRREEGRKEEVHWYPRDNCQRRRTELSLGMHCRREGE